MSASGKQKSVGRQIGYARVSTLEQTIDQQVYALRKAGCRKIFFDEGVSGKTVNRPGLEEARDYLREHDVFVVWAIDRAFRSTFDAIQFLDELRQRGIAFRSLTQQIDTRTPEGRKWFIDTASWAEYECEVISRRTKEKMAEAKRRGQHLGRPYALSRPKIIKAHRLIYEDGMELKTVAAFHRVSPITLKRAFRRLGLHATV